jgi:hypothetical protein
MSDDKEQQRPKTERRKMEPEGAPGTKLAGAKKERLRGPLDERWLERNIRDMYREVVEEPIPEDLLKILNRVQKLED